MLTPEQKQKIAELAAERDRACAEEEARLAAAAAARREANLVYWQPVLDAARAALPDWLVEDGRLEPASTEADLADRWVKLARECNLYTNYTAGVDLRDANDDHILTVTMRRQPDAWTPETYHVIDGADYGRYNCTDLELALLRLPAEDAKRRETRAAQEKCAAEEDDEEDDAETSYAEYKAQEAARAAEIKAAQDAERERRAQFESEVASLIECSENCILDADGDGNRGAGGVHEALAFSAAQSLVAIARILNDWRITAREYAQGNF